MEGSGRSYRIVERVGQGAFGSVYLAELEGAGLAKRVAIKVPHPDRATETFIARLRDEARLLSLIRHRSIVRVDDLLELDGQWSVIMEYIEGCDVAELVVDGPIPPRPALAIAEEVAQALHAAYHQSAPDGTPLRLLHRDIKPSNLRVTAAGEVKILDFGVARADFEHREAASTQSVFGTTTYLAPERYQGEDSRAGDVYALGVTLFEMLTGITPGKSAMDADRRPPGRKWAEQWRWLNQVSPELHELVASMMAMEADQRPTARECARRLAEIRMNLGGITLEDWAEKTVPVKAKGASRERDDKTGSLLIERSNSRARERPSGVPWWVLGVAGLGGILMVIAAAVAGAAWQAGWGSPPADVPVEAAPASSDPPVEAAPVGAPLAPEALEMGEPLPIPLGPELPPTGIDPAAPRADGAVAPPAEGPSEAARPLAPEAGENGAPKAGENGAPKAGENGAPKAGENGAPKAGENSAPKAGENGAQTVSAAGSGADAKAADPKAADPKPVETKAADPKPADPKPAETRAPPSGSGRLSVTGEFVSVRITGQSGAVRAGVVPPGRYTVEATFADGATALTEWVVVGAGQSVVVKCSPVFKTCKAQVQ